MNQRIAIFPGSFDPFTVGHKSIVDRALPLFDKLVIAIGYSEHKQGDWSVEERLEHIRRIYAGNPNVEVMAYTGLTADLARRLDVGYLVRGIRNTVDFEYERPLAEMNRRLAGVETLLLYTLPELGSVSSSMVRELRHFGADISDYIP